MKTQSAVWMYRKLKGLYFFQFGAMGVLFPILPLFFEWLGYRKSEIGILTSLKPAMSFVFGPTLCLLADAYSIHGMLTLTCHILSSAMIYLMNFVASYKVMLLLVLLSTIIRAPVNMQMDSHTLLLIGGQNYGNVRQYGAISYGFFSFVGGYLTGDDVSSFSTVFFLWAICCIVAGTFFYAIDLNDKSNVFDMERQAGINQDSDELTQLEEKEKEGNATISDSGTALTDIEEVRGVAHIESGYISISDNAYKKMTSVGQILTRKSVLVFLAVCFLAGMAFGIIESFLFIFLKEIGGGGLIFGLARFTMCMSEVPAFQCAGRILARIGTWRMLAITQLIFIVRNVYYTQLTNALWVFPAEVLHGVTFALMWSTSCAYADAIAPMGIESTFQSILNAIHFGIGASVGGVLGGFVYESKGAVFLFALNAFFCVCSFCLCVIAVLWGFRDEVLEKQEKRIRSDTREAAAIAMDTQMKVKVETGVEVEIGKTDSTYSNNPLHAVVSSVTSQRSNDYMKGEYQPTSQCDEHEECDD